MIRQIASSAHAVCCSLGILLACGAALLAGPALPARAAQASPEPALPAPAAGVAQPLPPAGEIPAAISLTVSGTPAADPAFLLAQIEAALDRRIRPTLRAGAAIGYGPLVPWPLVPLPSGGRATVDVTVTIEGDGTSAPVSAVTAVAVYSVPVAAVAPSVLFLSDDPEYLQSDGLVFHGSASIDRPARLYYYHSDIGAPRDVDVVLTAAAPAQAQIIASAGGPDLDVMSVGHGVSRDFLQYAQNDEGTIADIGPNRPFVIRHSLLLQGEVVAGTVDVHVTGGGPVDISVVAAPAGGSPEAFLGGPRVPYDGHRRHGTFAIAGYGNIAASYTVGAANAAVEFGGRVPTPQNLAASDDGRDYGDYGITQRITFTLVNPTDAPQLVYLYEKPRAGPVRGSFLVDGQLKELDCVREPQPYALSTYELPPHFTGVSTLLTMADGGSFYPVEIGATGAPPVATAPPPGTADGCSPKEPAFPDQPAGDAAPPSNAPNGGSQP